MDPAQVAPLQKLLRQESRSLLQYAAEAFPWTKTGEQGVCDAVRAMAQAEADAVAKIGRWLAKQRLPLTFPGAYPMHFTTSNYIAVRALLPRLIDDELRGIAELERVRAAMTDGESRALVQSLLELKKSHHQRFSALHASAAPAALAS